MAAGVNYYLTGALILLLSIPWGFAVARRLANGTEAHPVTLPTHSATV
jgi:hypothetical protein